MREDPFRHRALMRQAREERRVAKEKRMIMGLRILTVLETEREETSGAILYCSTSRRALPWIFEHEHDAIAFVERHGDIRRLDHKDQEKLVSAFYESKRKADSDHKLAFEILPDGFPYSSARGPRGFDLERAEIVHRRLEAQPAPADWQPSRPPIEQTLRYYVEWCRAWGDQQQRREADRIVIAQLPSREP